MIPLAEVKAQLDDKIGNSGLSPTPTSAPSPPTTAPSPPTTQPRLSRNLPDEGCYFNPNLLKCASIGEGGACPDNFGMNEDERCIPIKCPNGFKHLDEDETGVCYPLVIERIDQKIKSILTAMPSESKCNTVEQKNLDLLGGTLEKDDAVIVAVFSPCHIMDGEAILNLGQENENRVKLVGIQLAGDNVTSIAPFDTQKMQAKVENQTLNKVIFRETMLGTTHTGDEISIERINALALWNNSTEPVNLDKPVQLKLTISNESQAPITSEDINFPQFSTCCNTTVPEGEFLGDPMR